MKHVLTPITLSDLCGWRCVRCDRTWISVDQKTGSSVFPSTLSECPGKKRR